MGKHKTSASLGSLSNYASTETAAPEHETVYDRVEKLERRVSVLEGLLNDVMHQIDRPVRENPSNTQKKRINSHGKSEKPASTSPKRKPQKPQKKQDKSPKINATTLKHVREFLADGKKVQYREVHPLLLAAGRDCGIKSVKRCLHFLSKNGEVKVEVEVIDGKKVSFVTKK